MIYGRLSACVICILIVALLLSQLKAFPPVQAQNSRGGNILLSIGGGQISLRIDLIAEKDGSKVTATGKIDLSSGNVNLSLTGRHYGAGLVDTYTIGLQTGTLAWFFGIKVNTTIKLNNPSGGPPLGNFDIGLDLNTKGDLNTTSSANVTLNEKSLADLTVDWNTQHVEVTLVPQVKNYLINGNVAIGTGSGYLTGDISGDLATDQIVPTTMISTDATYVENESDPYTINFTSVTVVTQHSGGVGGIGLPIDKFALLAPYIGLASTITIASVASVILVKRRKKKE